MASVAGTQLTQKQETFAVVYVQTANATEAYRQAYDVAPDARDSWVYVEAAQLLDHPKIAPRIKELQEQAKKRGQFTVNKAFEELEEARALAHGEGQAGAAVSAVNSKIKLAGFEKPQKVASTDPEGNPIEIDKTELARNIAFLLAKGSQETDT